MKSPTQKISAVREENIKDKMYSLLHEFNRYMNFTGEKTPLERRAIKNKYVDLLYSLLIK